MAERAGLRPGDTIIEVNGTPFSGMTHDEALMVNQISFATLNGGTACMWSVSRTMVGRRRSEGRGEFTVKN